MRGLLILIFVHVLIRSSAAFDKCWGHFITILVSAVRQHILIGFMEPFYGKRQ